MWKKHNAISEHNCWNDNSQWKKQYPVLQDNIYIAPGAIIIGDITVGSDVAIGSNSVLAKSVEDYSVVVGIPGKVISKKGSREYVSNRI